jgi:hypothetical protein
MRGVYAFNVARQFGDKDAQDGLNVTNATVLGQYAHYQVLGVLGHPFVLIPSPELLAEVQAQKILRARVFLRHSRHISGQSTIVVILHITQKYAPFARLLVHHIFVKR